MITYISKMVPVDRIRRFKEQPREYFDPEEIEARAASIKMTGQQAPCTVERVIGDPKHDYELIDGESRWRSAQVAGIKEILVVIRSKPFGSTDEKHLASLVANFNRSEHTPMEISNALQRQIKAGLTQTMLARAIGKTQFWVSQYIALQDLHPVIKEMFDPTLPERERLPVSTGIILARVTPTRQLEALEAGRRSDGRIVKVKIEQFIEGHTEVKKRTREQGPSKRRARIEGALRTIGLGIDRVSKASPTEAMNIFRELKKTGDIQDVGSVEELLKILQPGVEGLERRFPDLPTDTSPDDMRDFWCRKVPEKDQYGVFLMAVAYPPSMRVPPFRPGKWAKEFK